ncbi:MAG: hypothetical protein JWM86_1376 [Thermoleophilia bacterium]|nr:hypothetical protein [Thermoleophilia bacterium]
MSTPVSNGPAAQPRPSTPAKPRVPSAPSKRAPDTPSAGAPPRPPSDTDLPRRGGTGASIGAAIGAKIRDLFGSEPRRPAGSRRQDGTSTLPPLTGDAAKLRDVAVATRAGRTWDPKRDDLVAGRNAHRSNTREEMQHALEGDYDWLEGDARVDKHGRVVMAHDADQESEGLSFEEWAQIGGTGGRGIKVDVKEPAAIPKILDSLERSGVPDGRIMLNVGGIPEEQAREIRRRYPDAWIALNPDVHEDGYHREDLQRVAKVADAVGGRIAFPVRWDEASDEVIRELAPHGKVSIWASQNQGTPDDQAAERERLIDRGIDGVIDLGQPQSVFDNLQERGLDIWTSGFGRGVRDLPGDVKARAADVVEGGKDLLEGGVELAGDGLGLAREGASHLPVVGGLFD